MGPRKPPVADPTDPIFRRWVIDLPPEKMHREVCARLRGRPDLEREAFGHWDFAGFPGWADDHPEMPLALRLRLAERLTITSPTIRAGFSVIPLLPFRTLVDPGPARPVPGIPTPQQVATQAIIAAFQRRLITEWWKPLPRHAGLLREYENLRATFAPRRSKGRSLWAAIGLTRRAPRTILVNGITYPVPRAEVRGGNPNPEPSELAVLFLVARHGGNDKEKRLRLKHARLERHIAEAWAGYTTWLADLARARAELDQVLSTVTREITAPARRPSLSP